MKFICMYADYLDIFRDLTDVRRGRLIMAILEYAFSGTERELRGEERLVFSMIRGQIDRDRQKYDETCQRNRANGSRGGRPRKKPAGSEENPGVFEKPIEKEKENENTREKENRNDNINIIVNENESFGGAGTGEAFSEPETDFGQLQPQPQEPTYDDIKRYCLENHLYHVNAEKFYDYYTANGWRMGRSAMADWRAALRNWNRKDEAQARLDASYEEDPVYTEFKRKYGITAVY